jgi:hypothetical protein
MDCFLFLGFVTDIIYWQSKIRSNRLRALIKIVEHIPLLWTFYFKDSNLPFLLKKGIHNHYVSRNALLLIFVDLNYYREDGCPISIDKVFIVVQNSLHSLNFPMTITMGLVIIHNPKLPQMPKKSIHKKN